MSTGTMTSKGQITVPKDVREALGLTAGSKLRFTKVDGRSYRLEVERQPPSLIELCGAVEYDGPPRSLEDIGAAVEAGATASVQHT